MTRTKPVIPVIHTHEFERKALHRDEDRCIHCGMPRYNIMGPFARRDVRMRLAYEDMETRLNRR